MSVVVYWCASFFQDDSGLYKNLLQELALKEGFSLPIYKTLRSGASHLPTFFSTVEIELDIFHGKAAKTKKQAEMNAAKVAYYGLKERRLSRSTEFLSLDCQEKGALECTSPSSHSIVTVDLQQTLKPKGPLVSTLSIRSKEHAEESRDVDHERIARRSEEHAEDTRGGDQEADSAEVISVNANASTHHFIPSPPKPDFESSSSTDMVYARLRDPFPSSPSSPEDSSSSPTKPSECSAVASNMEVPTGMGSFLLCNRVRVYPRRPDMAFPKGITLLPISDDKWVAVSLDFPNQEGN
ncbi:hypothetical protein HHK36_011553 [Tetracentron sinense]|uniref:DRBM domain-containing protein n=1 Tax=Tetracentron sinense TaxID=13715 RepID=A0A834Z8H7_TETSI|nr:hypothetical protein HHK36_011553 [Tetracentron sinense]